MSVYHERTAQRRFPAADAPPFAGASAQSPPTNLAFAVSRRRRFFSSDVKINSAPHNGLSVPTAVSYTHLTLPTILRV